MKTKGQAATLFDLTDLGVLAECTSIVFKPEALSRRRSFCFCGERQGKLFLILLGEERGRSAPSPNRGETLEAT